MKLICGYVRIDAEPASEQTLRAMAAAMRPAGTATRLEAHVAGTAALAVLDFSADAADAPATLDAAGLWLAADARLDRPQELADRLGLPHGTPQAQLLRAATRKWDQDFPERVDGDFAIASWDPSRQRLLCGRDIMGVRPLCYVHIEGRVLAFASLPKAIHGAGMVPRLPDVAAIARLTQQFYLSGHRTGYEQVRWLEAGHSLILEHGKLRTHRAWRPQPSQVGRWRGSHAEAAATLRELIIDAVHARMPASAPVAAHLSGGLDSSAINVIAARHARRSGNKLYAYSQVSPVIPGLDLLDERAYVNAVLAQEPDIQWMPIHFPALVGDSSPNDADVPTSEAGYLSETQICRHARAHGADLLLSGAGGDETATFNPANLRSQLLRRGHLVRVVRELRTISRRDQVSMLRLAVRTVRPLLPERLANALQRQRPPDRPEGLEFATPRLRAQIAAELAHPKPAPTSPQGRVQQLTDSYVVGRCTHWALIGAGYGLAYSFPLLDRRVIDYCLSLPLTQFAAEGRARQPYRTAMRGILPEAIRLRETKYTSLPDSAIRLAEAKPALLARVATLRSVPLVAASFDMDRIAAAIAAAPEADEARAAALQCNRGPIDPRLGQASKATQALALARHLSAFA